MKLKKLGISIGIGLYCCCSPAQYATNFYSIPDKTPNMGTNVWAYPETPGAYYWNGLRTALVIGLFALTIGAGVRHWVKE